MVRPSSDLERRRPLARMLAAQFADGFGARFNALVVALYALSIGGLGGFSGLLAVAALGSVLSAVATSAATTAFGAQRTMRLAAAMLAAARLMTYAMVLAGTPVTALFACRFVGSVAAGALTASAKSHAPRDAAAAASLAWFNVANGAGQAAAAGAAGALIAWAPLPVVVAAGATVGTLAIVPMFGLAERSVPEAAPWRDQRQAFRAVGPIATLGAAVTFVGMTLAALSDALVVDLFSASWLGAASVAAFGGSLAGATLLRRRPEVTTGPPPISWPLLAVAGVVGWHVAGLGPAALLGAVFAGAMTNQLLAAMVEECVLRRAAPAHSAPALAGAGALASLASAVGLLVVPRALESRGLAATATVLTAGGLLLAAAGWWKERTGTAPVNDRLARPRLLEALGARPAPIRSHDRRSGRGAAGVPVSGSVDV